MKQIYLLFFSILFTLMVSGQTVTTWQGPSSGGSWSDAANWSNGVPASGATEIVFDGAAPSLTGGAITITNVMQTNPNFSFDKLTVINNATVNLSAASSTYFYFGISINIATGSTLSVGASTTSLFIVGGVLSTITNINGTLDLQGQGTGNGTRTAFEPTNVSFGSTAVARVRGTIMLSGRVAVIGSSTPSNFIIENGGQLNITRDGGTVPNGNYTDGSLVKVQGVVNTATSFVSAIYNGTIEWNCRDQQVSGANALLLPSASFNSFDSLVINNTNTGSVRLATNPAGYLVKHIIMNSGTLELGSPTGSGAYVGNIDSLEQYGGTLIGNAPGVPGFDNAFNADTIVIRKLFLQSAGVFDLSTRTPNNASPDASCIVKVLGDFRVGGTIRLSQPVGAPNCAIEFAGTGTQLFSVTGSFLNKIKTVVNTSSPVTGISAASNITLPDSLVFKTGYFFLNNFDLTNPLPVQPVLNPFLTHVVTNGTGIFIQKNVSPFPVGIPIGATTTTVNPLIIAYASGIGDVGAKVDLGITPPILFPNAAINRTWSIKTIGTTAGNLAVSFGYTNLGVLGDGNPGFSYTANNELGLFDGSNWQIISLPGGVAPAGTNPFASSHLVLSNFLPANIPMPLVIGNVSSVLPVANVINFTATKNGSAALLKWDVTELSSTVRHFDIMRSNSNNSFETIATVPVVNGNIYYSFTDNDMKPGLNYYRVKIIDNNGRYKYSVIVAILNQQSGIAITGVFPGMVKDQAAVMISSAGQAPLQLKVIDMAGRVVKSINSKVNAGSTQVLLDCGSLAPGTYQVAAFSNGLPTNVARFIKY